MIKWKHKCLEDIKTEIVIIIIHTRYFLHMYVAFSILWISLDFCLVLHILALQVGQYLKNESLISTLIMWMKKLYRACELGMD